MADQRIVAGAVKEWVSLRDGKITPLPDAVVRGIARKFYGDSAGFELAMQQLTYDGLNGCYYFIHASMYHGVEDDGHIHT